MVQVGVDGQDSYGGSVNHKLDHMIGNREHGQLVQIDRANADIPVTMKPAVDLSHAPLNANSGAQAASLVVKTNAGILYGLTVYSNAVTQWIQIFNVNQLPADASVPLIVFEITADTARTFDFGMYGRYFSTGIVVCNSTTDVTKTIGAANCIIDAQYI